MSFVFEAKEKYRGVFEIQKSGNKTYSGEIGLDIKTHASPKVGQDQNSLSTQVILQVVVTGGDFRLFLFYVYCQNILSEISPFLQ